MRYSVCIIDNDTPAAGQQAQELGINDSTLLNASNLQLLLQKETWTDDVIKNLAQTLLIAKDSDGVSAKWEVYGFTNPSFYINAINDGFFRSDLVVFDWEYPGAQTGSETDSVSLLREILDRTFCLIFIFSKADKKTEIEAILERPEFLQYKERLYYLDKAVNNKDQTSVLLQKAEEMYSSNFSFKFASILRKKSVQSMDSILSDMGKASLNDVKNHVAHGDGGKKDFVDFLAERFRATIAGQDIYNLVDQIPEPASGSTPLDPIIVSKVWSNRLYFHPEPGDDLVRRGDIVSVGTAFYLILSADCDLGRFWKKNLGIINTVVLHTLDGSNADLKGWLTLCTKPKDLIPKQLSSLLANIGNLAEGPFVLPFVSFNSTQRNFVAVPKDILSQRISLPAEFSTLSEKDKTKVAVRYPHWSGAKRLCTISEPFLTPVIQHVLNALGGYGVPDYPDHMSEILKKILEEFGSAGVAVATPAPAAGAA